MSVNKEDEFKRRKWVKWVWIKKINIHEIDEYEKIYKCK